MSDEVSKEWVGTAWTRLLRNELVREPCRDVAQVVHVGIWIATYADASGENAFPSRETLNALTGYSLDRISRAVDVLVKVGLLVKKRRPNLTPAYSLTIPLGRLEWGTHIHLFTETRNKKKHAKAKAESVAEALTKMNAKKPDSERAHLPRPTRTASTLAVRTASVSGVPDSERAHLPKTPDSERAHRPAASTLAVRTASVTGGDQAQPLPAVVDQSPDHDMAAVGPQPLDAGARAREQWRLSMDSEIIRKVQEGEKLLQIERTRYKWLQGHRSVPVPVSSEGMSVV